MRTTSGLPSSEALSTTVACQLSAPAASGSDARHARRRSRLLVLTNETSTSSGAVSPCIGHLLVLPLPPLPQLGPVDQLIHGAHARIEEAHPAIAKALVLEVVQVEGSCGANERGPLTWCSGRKRGTRDVQFRVVVRLGQVLAHRVVVQMHVAVAAAQPNAVAAVEVFVLVPDRVTRGSTPKEDLAVVLAPEAVLQLPPEHERALPELETGYALRRIGENRPNFV